MGSLHDEFRAQDIMSPEPVCVSPATHIKELGRLLEANDISGAPVVDPQGRVIGIVSRTDLLRACTVGTSTVPPAYLYETLGEQGEEDAELLPEASVCVQDFMTEDPVTVGLDTPVSRIARLMHERRYHRVIVVDEEAFPLGIITSLDVLGAIRA